MAQSPPPTIRKRRKPLNIGRIKSVIVLVAATITGVGSALTGLGAQVAFAPMLSWMLGFGAEKAQATAMRYALLTAVAAVIGAAAVHVSPPLFLLRALVLFVGATIGAVVAATVMPKEPLQSRRAIFQTIGIGITLFVIVQTARLTTWNSPHFAAWSDLPRLLGMAVVLGVLTQALALASGILLVPALYYLGGFAAREAIVISLAVIALAAILPTASYARRKLIDETYGGIAALGGIVGGFAGGLMLARLPENLLLYLFALVGMFLCARELARMSNNRINTGK